MINSLLFRIIKGHDTTAAAINFTCFMIASYPEVQQKLHEDLDRVFDNDYDRPCTMDDLNELHYLECVIKETLRLYPSVPIIAREVQEDFTYSKFIEIFLAIVDYLINFYLDGYKILKGSSAVIFIYYIHRDPKHFSDPNRFDPDRFLPENSVDRSPYAFIPFSAGSRNCIGQRFAMLEEKVMLSWILRRFRLRTSQSRDELKISHEIILRSEHGAFVHIERL
jgi:cytochrome P450 family 4 subfamily V